MHYRNILLIDDDTDDREIFLEAVETISGPVECIAIGDAAVALEKLRTKELAPDVIFLDLNMPVMNGQQFLTELKRTEGLKEIPVIIFSTSSQPSTIRQTKELGAAGFITKPGMFNELVEILTTFLSNKPGSNF